MGNVRSRIEYTDGFARDERFSFANGADGYDGLDRLLVHRVVGGATVTVGYDAEGKGNIKSKSDVGLYDYTGYGPHAVSTAGAHSYTYDAVGNMLTGGGRTLDWTSFNQLERVGQGSKSAEFAFGAGHERVLQVRRTGGSVTDRTVYVGALYERVQSVGLIEHKHYILGPTGRIAVHTDRDDFTKDTRWFHTDGLGSITVITDEAGRVLKRHTYDAWGKQATSYTNTGAGITNTAPSTRGFTDHEMLGDFGLIHMNGRVYDPTLGRFLSADPNVDGVEDAQGYNRYSYVGNNPLGATDPTGFFSLKDALKIVAIIVVGVVTAGAALAAFTPLGFAGGIGAMFGVAGAASLTLGQAIIAGAAFGFGSSFAGSLLNGGSIGDAFKAGLIGAVVGGISAGIAHGIGTMAKAGEWGWELKAAAHGVAQGGMTEATGGQFRHGFYAGFFASAAGGKIDGIGEGKNWGSSARVAASAVVGGTASAIGGGKFANGAVSGAFVRLFNEEMHSGKKDYRAYYLLNKDSHTGDAVHGHAAALVEDPASGKYLLFSQAARFGRPMQMRPFDSIDDAMSSVFARQYESAIEFRMTADQATAAIRVGMKYLDSWLYDPTGLLFADNCASASCKILNAGGAGLAYGRQSSIPFILPNPYGPPIPMQAISPTEVFRVNAGRVGQTMKFGTH